MKTKTGYGSLLADGGFAAVLWAQFLGAFNHSTFGIIAMGFGIHYFVGAVIGIPFLVCAGYAGQIADRFSKTRVLQVTRALEIVVMLIATGILVARKMESLPTVLFLVATGTTFFSPAKYGILPDLVSDTQIVRANGLLWLTACIAIGVGASFGITLYGHWKGLTLVAAAICGWIASLGIRKMPAARPAERFHWNPFHEVVQGIQRLWSEKSLAFAVCGISWFWFAATLFLMAFFMGGAEVPQVPALVAGIGLGSVAAGALSGDYIELGLVPVGSALMGMFSIELAATASHVFAISCLVLTGFGAGLFVVPLNAFLQEKAGAPEKGRILATNNFANVAAAITASGVFWILHGKLQLHSGGIILAMGAVMLSCSFLIVKQMPECMVRFILWCTAMSLFRIRIEGGENIPRTGNALLVSNHISYADAVLVGCLARRRTIHFMMWKPIFDIPVANFFFRTLRAIPIDAASPKSTVRALRAARLALTNGELVGIFPEGEISRTGEVRSFERGFEKILQDTKAPLIPIRIEGLYGHPFSCKGGAPFQSWEKLWRPRVTLWVGAPIHDAISPVDLREAVVRA